MFSFDRIVAYISSDFQILASKERIEIHDIHNSFHKLKIEN